MLPVPVMLDGSGTDGAPHVVNDTSVILEEFQEHERHALINFIVCALLIFAVSITYNINARRWMKYIPVSGALMVAGIFLGFCLQILAWTTHARSTVWMQGKFQLYPETVYYFFLPPIIFHAGYTMKKRDFFLNMGPILMLALLGTLITAFVISFVLMAAGKMGLSSVDSSTLVEPLLFGALISAIDPVAILSIMGSPDMQTSPLVYSIVFGESVLNDAVSIVLFNTLSGYVGTDSFTTVDVMKLLGKFSLDTFLAVIIGLGVGLVSSFIFKHTKSLKEEHFLETTLLFLFAYASFLLAEICQVSGVMSLFLTAVIMQHFQWYSLSEKSQVTSVGLVGTASFLSETAIFLILGINVCNPHVVELIWDPLLILAAMIAIYIGRAASVFPLAAIANLFRSSEDKITWRMQAMLWFAGLRGAIAYALALNLTTPHRQEMISTTLFIVLFTTLVHGVLTAPVLQKLKLQVPHDLDKDSESEILVKESEEVPGEGDAITKKAVRISRMYSFWKVVDEKLKRWFGGKPRSVKWIEGGD